MCLCIQTQHTKLSLKSKRNLFNLIQSDIASYYIICRNSIAICERIATVMHAELPSASDICFNFLYDIDLYMYI